MRIVCQSCGNMMGEYAAGCVVIRHRGREIVAVGVVAIRCEKCEAIWHPPVRQEREPVVLKVAS